VANAAMGSALHLKKHQNEAKNVQKDAKKPHKRGLLGKAKNIECFKIRTGMRQEPTAPGAIPLVFCGIM
jgi:hypothetical protein